MSRVKTFWCLLNLPCEGMSRLASESLDRDLGRLEWVALRSHLLYCAACRRFQRQIKLLRCAMRRLAKRSRGRGAIARSRVSRTKCVSGSSAPSRKIERLRD